MLFRSVYDPDNTLPKNEDRVEIDLSDRLTFLTALDALYTWAFPDAALTGTLTHHPYRLSHTWGLAASHDPDAPMLTWGLTRKRMSDRHIDCPYSDDPRKGLALALSAVWGPK